MGGRVWLNRELFLATESPTMGGSPCLGGAIDTVHRDQQDRGLGPPPKQQKSRLLNTF